MKPRKWCQEYTEIKDLELKRQKLFRNLQLQKKKNNLKIATIELVYFLCCLIGLVAFIWSVTQLTYILNQ